MYQRERENLKRKKRKKKKKIQKNEKSTPETLVFPSLWLGSYLDLLPFDVKLLKFFCPVFDAGPVSLPADPVFFPADPVSLPADPVSLPADLVSLPADPVSSPLKNYLYITFKLVA